MKEFKEQLLNMQSIAATAIELALEQGASEAELSIQANEGFDVTVHQQQVENLSFSENQALSLTVYWNKQAGSASTNDLSSGALRLAVEAALAAAKSSNLDPYGGLADPKFLAKEIQDLDLYHPIDIPLEEKIALALACEQAGLDYDQRITNTDGTNLSGNNGFRLYANSNNWMGSYPSSSYSLSSAMLAKEGDDLQQDYDYSLSHKWADLGSPQAIGQKAAKQALAKLGARKLATKQVPIIFQADVAARLWSHLLRAISGPNLYNKASFLLDKLGQRILPPSISIIEDPFVLGGLASSPFDNEGLTCHKRHLFKDGNLESYLLSAYAARKLGMDPTGNGGGEHNVLISSSEQNLGSLEQLLAQMGTGLLVSDLLGNGANIITGDYSSGAAGFWVENGKIQFPVAEVTIAGNLNEIFKNIVAIGSDIDYRSHIQTGSVLISNMMVAGS